MLAAFDPEAANSLKNVAKLSKADFEAMTELEDCSGMSREQYLRHAVAAALGIGGESGWMVENLRSGFWSVIARELLEEMRVAQGDLMEMICGAEATGSRSSQFDVQHVFRVVLDEELEGSSKAASPLASALWEVVGTWPADLRRQFVLFVTGSDRLPLPGTELLRVELPFVAISSKDHMQMLGMLPQVCPCPGWCGWSCLVSRKR